MPRLLIRKGEGEGTDHALSGPCIVGRHASANFVLGDQLVSRNHFRVVSQAGAWFVEDLGSTNGTIVNGRRQKRAQLTDGDVIVAGTTELQFVQKDLLGGAPVRTAVPAIPVAVAPAAAVAPAPALLPPVTVTAPAAVPIAPAPRPVLPAVPAPARPAIPAVPARPAAPSLAKPAPASPPKPQIQAPIPSKKRR
jgi:predicted component of type VI protein secretion system